MFIEYWKQLDSSTPAQWIVGLLCIALLYFFLHVFPYKFPKQAKQFHDFYFGKDKK